MQLPRVVFVLQMDGATLPDLFGSPLRVICPPKYGYKGAKAITKITWQEAGGPGYWSTVGYYTTDGTIEPGIDRPVDLGDVRELKGGEVTDY